MMNTAYRASGVKKYWQPRTAASLATILLLLLGLAACSSGPSASSALASSATALPAATAPSQLTTAAAAPAATALPAATAAAASVAEPTGTAVPTAAASSSTGSSLGDFSAAIRNVVQQIKPAVVQITNEQYQVDGFTNTPFTVPAGVGSGVLYDAQGHILTNNHVIEGAQQLTVALPGGPTVSAGVVSALGRTVQEPGQSNGSPGPYLFDVVQTDAPINPGNSGGPLVDLHGRVIGINTLVAGQAEPGVQAQGIGFAISIAAAKPIADQLVATGQVTHPYIGVQQVPLNAVIASRLGTDTKSGVVVVAVGPGTPAAAAGLRSRDIITAIDSANVTDDSDFAKIIDSHKPGDTIDLTVVRGKQTIHVKATLAARPA
jgi:serine protease Do